MHSAAAAYLWTQGRNEKLDAASADGEMATAARTDVTAAAASISYTGSCTSSQKSSLASAVTAATNYTVSSTNYLNGTPSATPRYTTWFGAYSSTRWATARDHFTKARNAFQGAALTLDCSCKDSGTYTRPSPTRSMSAAPSGAPR
jgi:peptidyl-Lys metalloendopeptidase